MNRKVIGGLALLVVLSNCSGGASSTDSTDATSVAVSSLTSIPDLSSIVDSGTANASLSASESVVSGTPPYLKDIDSDAAKDLFWNQALDDSLTDNLIDTINGSETADITGDMRNSLWVGEGSCRMAQNTGQSFQQMLQAGTSLCYMQNAPDVDEGVELTSSSLNGLNKNNLFNQTASSKLIKVIPSQEDGDDPEANQSNIFIKIYGTQSSPGDVGYAADLYFCGKSDNILRAYEELRINTAEKTLSHVDVEHRSETESGVFTVSGFLKRGSNGRIIFDASRERSANATFINENHAFKTAFTINDGTMVNRNWSEYNFTNQEGNPETQKSWQYVKSHFTGSSINDLRFSSAGYSMVFFRDDEAMDMDNDGQPDSQPGATIFHDTYYAPITDSEDSLLSEANDFTFASFTDDGFWTDEMEDADFDAKVGALADTDRFNCNATPDAIVNMDMGSTGMQEVRTLCEPGFRHSTEFCDDSDVRQARYTSFDSLQNSFAPDIGGIYDIISVRGVDAIGNRCPNPGDFTFGIVNTGDNVHYDLPQGADANLMITPNQGDITQGSCSGAFGTNTPLSNCTYSITNGTTVTIHTDYGPAGDTCEGLTIRK